jgi:metal-sulfur cluster biosynthetic enzyme
MAKLPLYPSHPERICWGCDRLCRADKLSCGNDQRTQHPIELLGSDWVEWVRERRGDDCFDLPEDRCAPAAGVTDGTEKRALRERALHALRNVIDFGLGVNVVDLGLVYALEVDDARVIRAELSMTTPASPRDDHIVREAEDRLRAVSGIRAANVRLVRSPPWDPSRMSTQVRALLGWSS